MTADPLHRWKVIGVVSTAVIVLCVIALIMAYFRFGRKKSTARPAGASPGPAPDLFEVTTLALDEYELGQAPLILAEGPGQIDTIGIVTGAGAGEIHTAIELGLDAFLTGEPAEHVMADAREGGIHFIAGGHYATEKAGVRRLGELLAERFGVEHEFIDVPNPI